MASSNIFLTDVTLILCKEMLDLVSVACIIKFCFISIFVSWTDLSTYFGRNEIAADYQAC